MDDSVLSKLTRIKWKGHEILFASFTGFHRTVNTNKEFALTQNSLACPTPILAATNNVNSMGQPWVRSPCILFISPHKLGNHMQIVGMVNIWTGILPEGAAQTQTGALLSAPDNERTAVISSHANSSTLSALFLCVAPIVGMNSVVRNCRCFDRCELHSLYLRS